VKKKGSIFKIMYLEDFSLETPGVTRKERAERIIKNLLRTLQDHDYKAEIKHIIKPSMYKVQIEVLFVEDSFYNSLTRVTENIK